MIIDADGPDRPGTELIYPTHKLEMTGGYGPVIREASGGAGDPPPDRSADRSADSRPYPSSDPFALLNVRFETGE